MKFLREKYCHHRAPACLLNFKKSKTLGQQQGCYKPFRHSSLYLQLQKEIKINSCVQSMEPGYLFYCMFLDGFTVFNFSRGRMMCVCHICSFNLYLSSLFTFWSTYIVFVGPSPISSIDADEPRVSHTSSTSLHCMVIALGKFSFCPG